MKSKGLIRAVIILVIVIVSVALDQLSKNIVRRDLIPNREISYLGNHFILTRVENTGAFLSLGDSISGPLRFILLTLLPILALVAGLVIVIVRRDIDRWVLLAVCLMIGGGIGNIYDRLVHGSVTDFLYIGFGFLHTGVFNVADIWVSAGFLILLFHSWFNRKKPELAK